MRYFLLIFKLDTTILLIHKSIKTEVSFVVEDEFY